jgi:hypothetical protein
VASRQRKKRKCNKYDHLEYRKHVTLAQFYSQRLNALDIPFGSIANAAVFGCPVDRPRAKTKDLVPFSDKTLARLAKPLTTPVCADFYRKGAPAWTKLPRYVDWLRSIGAGPVKAPPKPRAKRKPKAAPMFQESAPERWRDFPMEDIPCFSAL